MAADNPADHVEDPIIGGREGGPVVIADYDPVWVDRYERGRARIADALGGMAKSIEHIGSTSIPHLGAKPVIDIMVTVDDPEVDNAFIAAFASIGFVLRVREPGHRMFRPADKTVHVHVWAHAGEEAERHLVFRNWLRAHPDDRERYERKKRELATREWSDRNDYAEAKTPVIEAIMERARRT